MFALAIFFSAVPVFAQEIPRIPVERETPKELTREERESEALRQEILNGGHINAPRETIKIRQERIALSQLRSVAMEVRWGEGPTPAVKDVEDFLRSDPRKMILSSGVLPADRVIRQQWRALNDKYADRIITREPESANKTSRDILGTR